MGIPRQIHLFFLFITVLGLIPPVVIARARHTKSPQPRIHPIPDMDNQKKYRAQAEHPGYADKSAMRPRVVGTVARGQLRIDEHLHQGYRDAAAGPQFFENFPTQITVNAELIDRGEDRFGIYCTPCHGYSGDGDGMVAARASVVSAQTWLFDLNLHSDERRGRSVGHLFNTITNGNANMAPYKYQLSVEDRWAIVAYVKALQESQK